MIRIFSGWGNMGGSTVAFINLVNLLNKNGHDAILYAPKSGTPPKAWFSDQCKSEVIESYFLKDFINTPRQAETVLANSGFLNEALELGDILICHLLPLYFENIDKGRLKKVIYSCHETDLYSVSGINMSKFDYIHYVSEFQKDFLFYLTLIFSLSTILRQNPCIAAYSPVDQ